MNIDVNVLLFSLNMMLLSLAHVIRKKFGRVTSPIESCSVMNGIVRGPATRILQWLAALMPYTYTFLLNDLELLQQSQQSAVKLLLLAAIVQYTVRVRVLRARRCLQEKSPITDNFFLCHIKLNEVYLQNVLYEQYGQFSKCVLCSFHNPILRCRASMCRHLTTCNN